MPKDGEISYIRRIGEAGARHAADKPFSDPNCAGYLTSMAAVMALMPPPPARVLDLGCGTGWTSVFLARRGYEVTGVDIAEDMIRLAEEKKAGEKADRLTFVVSDYEDMTFEDEFDCVLFFDSLHHAEDEGKAVRTAYRALTRGGLCITVEPGRRHEESREAREAVRKYNVTEKDMPPSRVISAGRRAGFRRFRVYPQAARVNTALYGDPPTTRLRGIGRLRVVRTLAVLFAMLPGRRRNGIVVMKK